MKRLILSIFLPFLFLIVLASAFVFFLKPISTTEKSQNIDSEHLKISSESQVFRLRSIKENDEANSYALVARASRIPEKNKEGYYLKLSLLDMQGSSQNLTEQSEFLVFLGESSDVIDTLEKDVSGDFVNYVSKPVSEVIEKIDFSLPVEIRLNTVLSQEFISSCNEDWCDALLKKTESNKSNELALEKMVDSGLIVPGNYVFNAYYLSNPY